MINLEPHKERVSEKQGLESVIPDKQEYKFVGSIPHKSGMKLFSIDSDGVVKEVVFRSTAALTLEGDTDIKHNAQYDPRLKYIQAINKKNAIRKFSQGKYIQL